MRGNILIIHSFLTLALSAFAPSVVGAQSANGPARPVTPEMIGAMAERLQLDPNSRHMQTILQARLKGPAATDAREREFVEEGEAVRPIVLHLRSTKGIALPKPEEIPPVFHITKEQEQEIVDLHMQGVERIKEMHQQVPQLPRCAKNQTTRESTGMKGMNGDKTTLFDMLFIAQKDLPLDSKGVFGKDTLVQPFMSDKPNSGAFATIGVGVTCLPTRMRATKAFVYRDEGANALKNYDKSPHGKGDVDPRIAELVKSF